MPKETGLMFKAPLVNAILEGRKTQTRRVMKPQLEQCDWFPSWYLPTGPEEGIFWPNGKNKILTLSPYGQPGDLIYVRETWQHGNYPLGPYEEGAPVYYRADFLDDPDGPDGEKSPQGKYRDWQPSIHMPKSAARIWLEITGVRIEQLKNISQADAIAEGAPPSHPSIDQISMEFGYSDFSRSWFAQTWESTGASWAANPWVWVYEFKRANQVSARGE